MARDLVRRAATLLLLCWGVAYARTESQPKLQPGPTTISPEESARAVDPAAGVVDAVIFIEETKRIETGPGRAKIWYHARAKVLSEAGLRLATLAIPNVDEKTKVKKWWAHVLLPTGGGYTLTGDKLDDRTDPVTGERSIRGTLTRAVPGCVIDWGYLVTRALSPAFEIVPLQREWPVDHLVFRWRRYGGSTFEPDAGGYEVKDAAPRIDVIDDKQGRLLRAEQLAGVAPGPGARSAALVLWDTHSVRVGDAELIQWSEVEKRFWNQQAIQIEAEIAGFRGSPERLRAALQSIPGLQSGELSERLRAAYDWIDANVKVNPSKLSTTPGVAVRRIRRNADKVLDARLGTPIERTLCFVIIARELGADAALVLATDRKKWSWDRGLLLVEQLSDALVEVRTRGDGDARFAAVGSGLPYGSVPEELSGGKGLKATSGGEEIVEIPSTASPE